MKIKNIKVGMRVKNYAEMCRLLKIKIQRGNGKIKQLNDFKRYFEWTKDGNAFIITKVYNKPRAFTEGEMIELLILNLLSNADPKNNCTVIATRRSIFEKLNMVNKNFNYCLHNQDELALFKNIDEDIVSDIVRSIDSSLGNKLKSALKRLSKKRVLFATEVYMISCFDDKIHSSHRVATDEEISMCLDIEHRVYRELNCEEYKDIMIRKLERQFTKKLKKALSEVRVDSFYRAVKIVFVNAEMPNVLEKYLYKYKLSKRKYAQYTGEINNGIKEQTVTNAKRRHVTSKGGAQNKKIQTEEELIGIALENKKSTFGKARLKYEEHLKIKNEYEKQIRELEKLSMRADDDYLKHVDSLISLLIDDSTDSIIQNIKDVVEKYKKQT